MNVLSPLDLILGFYREHPSSQCGVVMGAISARMNAPVAVRTKRDHVPRIVGAAICHSSNVMRFQIWNAIRPQKWGRGFATLTITHRSGNDVVTNISAALENSSRLLCFTWAVLGGLHCLFAKCRKIRRRCANRRRNRFNDFNQASDRPQLKDNGVAEIVFTIWCAFDVVRVIDKLVLKSQAGLCLGEKKQALTVNRVVRNSLVAGTNGHVADLAFAEVFKHSIGTPPVSIAVFKAFFARNDNNQSMLGRRDDPALLLPPERRVNVSTPIINTAALKAPTHRIPQTKYAPIEPFHLDQRFSMGVAA